MNESSATVPVALEDAQFLCQEADEILQKITPAARKENDGTQSIPQSSEVSVEGTAKDGDQTSASLDRALKLYYQGLSTRRNILGEHHPLVAATRRSIARALKNHRHYVDALDAYKAALGAYSQGTNTNNDNNNNNIDNCTSVSIIQNEVNELMDTMVDAANYYMMQGLGLQARHLRDDALVQFEYAHSLLSNIVVALERKDGGSSLITLASTTSTESAVNKKVDGNNIIPPTDASSFPSELELSMSLCHVCRVIASVHVSASQYTTALPFLEQAHSRLERMLGKDDQRTLAMASDVVTLQALMKKQYPSYRASADRNRNNSNNSSTMLDYDDLDEPQIIHWFERDDYNNASNDNAENTKAEDGSSSSAKDKPRGISIDWIKRGFWREIQEAKLGPNATIEEVVTTVIEPKFAEGDSAYLDLVEDVHTAPASVVVICAENSTIGEIINSMDDYCRVNSYSDKNVYVWLSFLCQSATLQLKTSREELQKFISTIGHALAILSPWYDPAIWKSSSCLWEIYLAHQIHNCKLTLVLPPSQTAAVADALMGDPALPVANLYKCLDALQVDTTPLDNISKNEVCHRLQAIFRPWIRDVLMSHVQEHCTPSDNEINPPSSNPAPTSSPMTRGEAALDVFKLQLCNKMGLLFWHYGEYKTALELLEDALVMTEAIYGEQYESTATVYQNIGNVLSDMGRYELALETYQKVLKLREGLLPEHDPRVADICTKVGNLYRITANLDQAMRFHQRALSIYMALQGNHSNLASADSYNDMGNVFYDRGDFDAALVEFRKALKIQESILGKRNPSLATTHSFIGMSLKRKGNKSGALQEYETALAIQEETLGEGHVETAMTYENLASVLRSQDNLEGALEMGEKARSTYEKALGVYHPSTATVLQSLGTIHNDLDNVNDALTSYRTALEIREVVLGGAHLSVAESLRSIGILLFEIGDLDGALIELRKAFSIMEPLLGVDHPTVKKLADTINEVLEA